MLQFPWKSCHTLGSRGFTGVEMVNEGAPSPAPADADPRVVHWPCSCLRVLEVPREMAEDVIECPWCARLTSFRGPIPEFECPHCRRRYPVYATFAGAGECLSCVLSRLLRRLKETAIVILIGLATIGLFYLFYFLRIR